MCCGGGPGCSGLLGMLAENGPYRPADNGEVLDNFPYRCDIDVFLSKLISLLFLLLPYLFHLHLSRWFLLIPLFLFNISWTTSASVIFVEQPLFVGYSISSEDEDYVTDDDINGERLVTFLVNWFEKFDTYKGRDLYLAAESYGGHYM